MFIEYRGTFFTFESASSDVETMWLTAMNTDVPNAVHLITLHQTAKLYGCSYGTRHDKSVATIKLIDINNQTGAP